MSYTGEVRLILEKALERLESEGSLDPKFLEGLRKLFVEGKLQEEAEITKILESLIQGGAEWPSD